MTRVCLVAFKDLRLNTRVLRQAGTLAEAGIEVSIVAPTAPDFGACLPSGVEFTRADAAHPLQALTRLLQALRREPAPDGGAGDAARAGELYAAAPVHPLLLPLRWFARPFGEPLLTRGFARAVRRACAGRRFDCIQAHDSRSLHAAWRLARDSECPMVFDAVEAPDSRSGWQPRGPEKLVRRIQSGTEASIVKRCRLIMTIGPALGEWLRRRYGTARPLVIRNCQPFQTSCGVSPLREELGIGADSCVVLYLNSIVPRQGLEHLIEALAELPGAHLVVLGPCPDPAYRRSLERRAGTAAVRDRIHFAPLQRPGDVVAYASGADVGVVVLEDSSVNTYLCLPNRVFQYVMARLPMVVPAFPDLQALVEEHGIGVVFEHTAPPAVAGAIAQALAMAYNGDAGERLEAAARTLCWEEEGKRYLQGIREVLAGPATRDRRADAAAERVNDTFESKSGRKAS